MSDQDSQNQGMPQPHPSLQALKPFVGRWSIKGRTVGADKDNIKGEATFDFLPGGFFLKQHIHMDFDGYEIDALEIIGHDPQKDSLESFVYSNGVGVPLPYSWRVEGDNVYISVNYGDFVADFEGKFEDGGKSYHGSWRPAPGKEAPGNVAYDITGHRID